MSTLIVGIITFLLHALVLKLAIGAVGVPATKNRYPKAVSIAFGLSIAGFIVGFIPLVSGLVYGILWLVVIMSAYDLGLFKSFGVALVQVGLNIVVWLVLTLVGMSTLAANTTMLGW